MTKCLKCGAELPPQGECPNCAQGVKQQVVPSLLQRDLQLDRRARLPNPSAPPRPAGAAQGLAPRAPAGTPPMQQRPVAAPMSQRPKMAAPPPPRAAAGLPSPPPASPRPQRPPATAQRQAAPPPRAPDAHATIEIKARPAAFWRRGIALAIDTVAVLLVLALYLLIALAIAGKPVGGTHLTGLDAWMTRAQSVQTILVPGLLLAAVLAIAYSAAFGFLWDGRTPGRWVAHIRLVDRSGLAPAPARAILRAFLASLSFAIFLGGFWLALVDRRGQTLHDKLTRTFLVQRTP